MPTPPAPDRSDAAPVRLAPLAERTRAGAPRLPAPLTPLIGREREVAALAGLLRRPEVRLVTLTGPGGVGKTRVALAAAEALAGAFADGVAFVSLAPIGDPSLVASAIARALGLRESRDRPLPAALRDHLQTRALLLVLDNVEHVLPAAPLVAELLAACPALTALVTSRAVLRLSGEHAVPVPPLAVPDPDRPPPLADLAANAAVRLFVARAGAARASFALVPEHATAVAAICRRLEGLPLAIELAAARVAVLPPAALLARLDRRLPLLVDGPRDQPARLRTLRDALAWSYDLLPPAEQALFRRLAVFAGGVALEAAAVVPTSGDAGSGTDAGSEVLAGVASLVGKSLLEPAEGPGGEPRFRMLETIREFALERLAASGEAEAVRRRHAAWCVELAERGYAALVRGRAVEPRWLERLEAEHDNLRAALAWAERTGEAETALRLAGALGPFWYFGGHRAEGRGRLERALAGGADAPAALRARALTGLGVFLGDAGDRARGAALLGQSLALSEAAGTAWDVAEARLLLGWLAEEAGRYEPAAAHLAAALAAFRAVGADWWVALARYHLGIVARGQGDAARAHACLAEALAAYRGFGDGWGIGIATRALGAVARDRGDRAAAAALYREGLVCWREAGTAEGLAGWLAEVATLAAVGGRAAEAARLFGALAAVRDPLGAAFELPTRAQVERAERAARAELGGAAFAAAVAAGRALSRDEAFAEATRVVEDIAAVAAGPTCGEADNLPPHARLTRREREVLGLLVEGRTDREIAAALCLSPRTVGHHVGHILAKLGVETRRGARAHALQQGFVPTAASGPG